MVLQRVCRVTAVAVLICGGAAAAADYRPDEYLGLDLSRAVVSPKRLGPPTQFAPVAVEPSADNKADINVESKAATDQVVAGPAATRKVATERVRVAPERKSGHARTKLTRRHTNALDAQAMDTRIQVWPCRSGGICDWKR